MTVYSPDLCDDICKRIGEGESLVKICKDKCIDYSNVIKWLRDEDKKEFTLNYTRARENQADFYAEQVIDISDDTTILPEDRKIKIDARKWRAGGLKPKKYGEKRIVSGDDESPLNVKHSGAIDIGADAIAAQIERILSK